MNIWSVIVAGGSGARFGAMKQLQMLGHQRVLDWAVQAMVQATEGVVVVVPEELVAQIRQSLDNPAGRNTVVVAGGQSRAESVRAGLQVIGSDVTHVLVHDAARPLTSTAIIDRVIAALVEGSDGAIPVVPVTDTLRTVEGNPVDRAGFVAVQTPQGFGIEILRAAHEQGGEATDDATLVSRNGGSVVHVAGEARNMKITVSQDLQVAEALL